MNKNNQAGGHNTAQSSGRSGSSGEDKHHQQAGNQSGSQGSGDQQSGQQN